MKEVRDYKTAILGFLEKCTQPMGVESIRVACKIGNWETALRHCLELERDGTIRATKSSKSWIFWAKTKRRWIE